MNYPWRDASFLAGLALRLFRPMRLHLQQPNPPCLIASPAGGPIIFPSTPIFLIGLVSKCSYGNNAVRGTGVLVAQTPDFELPQTDMPPDT